MTEPEPTAQPRSRGRKFARRARRLWSVDVQMQLAVLSLNRWYGLSPAEQDRFRELAPRAGQLGSAEEKELRRIWKQLDVKGLVMAALHLLTDERG